MTKNKHKINAYIRIITFVLGCFFSANQLIINNIKLAFGASESQMAMMIGGLYAGPLLMVLVFGTLSDRIGRKRSASLGLAMVIIGLILLITSINILLIVIGFFIYGAGISGTESVLFAITSDVNGDKSGKHLAFNQALFSIGAMLSPIIISASLPSDSYRLVYFIILVFTVMILLTLGKLETDQRNDILIKKEAKVTLLHIIRSPIIILCMATIIVSTGSESALTYWVSLFFESLGAENLGAIALSVYWFASILGRLVCSRIEKLEKVIMPSLIGASIGVILLLFLPGTSLKLIGLLIIGASFAPIYPALGYRASNLYPQNKGAAFSIITFSSNLGGVVSQPIISFVSGRASIFVIYIVVAALCGLLSVITIIVQRLKRFNT